MISTDNQTGVPGEQNLSQPSVVFTPRLGNLSIWKTFHVQCECGGLGKENWLGENLLLRRLVEETF